MNNYHLDFETRSRANLSDVGAYRYASDPSTRILSFAIKGPGVVAPLLWQTGASTAKRQAAIGLLEQAVKDPNGLIWAHNVGFELAVATYRLLKDVGVAPPALSKWRCTAALARRAGLPDGLEQLAQTLNLSAQKDARGKKLINLFSKPQKDGTFADPTAHPAEFRDFGEYNITDVSVEEQVHHALEPFELTGALLDVFLFDLKINHEGIPVNVPALKNAKKILDEELFNVEEAFVSLTGLRPTQREKVKQLLASCGLDMPDMQADTVTEAVKTATGKALRILEIYSTVQYAAARKVYTMLDCVCADGYVRGTLMFHGAGTGRWSGKLIQPQNFKRPTIKGSENAYHLICEGHGTEDIRLVYPQPLEALASCIRNFIQPHSGEVYDADYNAIEARIVNWLAGQEDVLDMYRGGRDLYKFMAGMIYGRPEKDIVNPSEERELGKRAILGCGYQMAHEKFRETCLGQYGIAISEDLAIKAVRMYRELCHKVVDLWYACEDAARRAVSHPGERFDAGDHLSFVVKKLRGRKYLLMNLPSGRAICYPDPELVDKKTKFGIKKQVTFYGNVKGKHWGRVSTYGGKLVENATQGTAFDVMGHGSVRATAKGFRIFTLIHDQSLAYRHPTLTVEDYCKALTDLPSWATGMPIKAEGKITPFYKK